MNTTVRFRSSKFPPEAGEEDAINPGIWGKRLVNYISTNLAALGFSTEEPAVEDWGYWLPIKVNGKQIALRCSHQQGEDDEFIVFTDPIQPRVRKLFRTIDLEEEFKVLLEALDKTLRSDGEINSIQWSED